MVGKKRNVILTNKVEKIPGLSIVLPGGVSAQARRRALSIGKKEIERTSTAKTAQLRSDLAAMEETIADFIKDRTLEIGPQAHRSTKYYVTKSGKRLKITKGTDRGKKVEVKDIGEIIGVIKRIAQNMESR